MKPILPLTLLAALLPAGALSAQACTTDDFQTVTVGGNGNLNTGVFTITDTTVIQGQGPGLVADGCSYQSIGGIWNWTDAGYYGLPGKSINSSTPDFSLVYDQDVDLVTFELSTYANLGFTANVRAYDVNGMQIWLDPAVAVPGGASNTVNISVPNIRRVTVFRLGGGGSAHIDNHTYCGASTAPSLSLLGTCGQPGSALEARNMTPGGQVGFAWSANLGAFTPNVGGCGPVVTGLASPVTSLGLFPAAPTGIATLTPTNGVPAGACGRIHLQALDLTSCQTTNVLSL